MKLVLKGVSTQINLEDGAEFHTLDFIAEDGPEGILSLPVPRDTVTALMQQLRGDEEPEPAPPEEEEEEVEEEPPQPPPPVRPPVTPRVASTFQSARKRMAAAQAGDDKVPPL